MSVLDVNALSVFQCKCAQYWPDQGCWTYGNIRVSVEDTMVLVDYTIRKFCIQQVIIYWCVYQDIIVLSSHFPLEVLVYCVIYKTI